MIESPDINAYLDLANSIVIQAAEDYRNALRGITYDQKPVESVINDCLRFFRSEWFRCLTKVNGEYLIEQLDKEYLEFCREENNNECNVNPSNT